jgi:hypothetical protein
MNRKTPSQIRAEKNAAHNAKRREGFAKGITSPDRLNRYARGEADPVRDNPKALATARRKS